SDQVGAAVADVRPPQVGIVDNDGDDRRRGWAKLRLGVGSLATPDQDVGGLERQLQSFARFMGSQLYGQLGGDHADRLFTGSLAPFEPTNAVGNHKQML